MVCRAGSVEQGREIKSVTVALWANIIASVAACMGAARDAEETRIGHLRLEFEIAKKLPLPIGKNPSGASLYRALAEVS